MILKMTILMISIFVACPGFANSGTITKSSRSPKATAPHLDRVEVDFSSRQDVRFAGLEPTFNASHVAVAIPLNMRNTSDGLKVEKDILKHWGSNIVKSSYVKNSRLLRSLKRTASSFEKATQVEIKTSEKKKETKPKAKSPVDLVPLPQKTNHDFKFKLQALKREARLIYQGFFNSTLTYKQKSNTLIFQAHKSLSKNANIGISAKAEPIGSSQFINYGYSW